MAKPTCIACAGAGGISEEKVQQMIDTSIAEIPKEWVKDESTDWTKHFDENGKLKHEIILIVSRDYHVSSAAVTKQIMYYFPFNTERGKRITKMFMESNGSSYQIMLIGFETNSLNNSSGSITGSGSLLEIKSDGTVNWIGTTDYSFVKNATSNKVAQLYYKD